VKDCNPKNKSEGVYYGKIQSASVRLYVKNYYYSWTDGVDVKVDSGYFKRNGDSLFLFSLWEREHEMYKGFTRNFYSPRTGTSAIIKKDGLLFRYEQRTDFDNELFSKCNDPVMAE
jgi:hypothetical protein